MGVSDEGSSNGEGNSKDWRWIGDGEAVWFISSIVNYLIGVHPFYPLKYLMTTIGISISGSNANSRLQGYQFLDDLG